MRPKYVLEKLKPPCPLCTPAIVHESDSKKNRTKINGETRHPNCIKAQLRLSGSTSSCRHSSIYLEVSRGGAVLPAAQGLDDGGATQRTRSLPVEPQAQALLAEHMLRREHVVFSTKKFKMDGCGIWFMFSLHPDLLFTDYSRSNPREFLSSMISCVMK